MYDVPKLADYSAAALERASAELVSALGDESSAVKNEADWKIFRDRWMARKNGVLTQINDLWLKGAPKDARRDVGQHVNEIKAVVTAQVEALRPKRELIIGTAASQQARQQTHASGV